MPEKRLTYGQWKSEVEQEGFRVISSETLRGYRSIIEAFGLLKAHLEDQEALLAENRALRAALEQGAFSSRGLELETKKRTI